MAREKESDALVAFEKSSHMYIPTTFLSVSVGTLPRWCAYSIICVECMTGFSKSLYLVTQVLWPLTQTSSSNITALISITQHRVDKIPKRR